jgi:hypothetical protein
LVAQIGEADDEEKICQFNGRSKYRNYYIGRSIEFFLLPKDLGNIKEKKFRSVMVVMDLTFVMELLCFFAKRRNPLDIDFKSKGIN